MKIYVSIGGNLGNREQNLENALHDFVDNTGSLVALSPVYETEPFGFESKDQFLNLVAVIETKLAPDEILDSIKLIEENLGRKRGVEKNISRTIDIDLLFFENQIIDSEELTVPHQGIHKRKFVLVPFADIAPGFIHPVYGKTIAELLVECNDEGIVKKKYNILNTDNQSTPLSAKL